MTMQLMSEKRQTDHSFYKQDDVLKRAGTECRMDGTYMDEQKKKDVQCSADDHNVWDGSGD